ncbi:MAG TPA: hypothetical protein ENL09_01335 [Bacteroidetes bacterium]|nr:hypothetical protein [Bacteroidota bacterium]
MRSMLNLFIDRTPGLVNKMQEACKNQDFLQTVKLAHQLKPSVDMMGNDRLTELLFKIHEITKSEANCKRSLELIDAYSIQTKKVIGLIDEKLKQQKLI